MSEPTWKRGAEALGEDIRNIDWGAAASAGADPEPHRPAPTAVLLKCGCGAWHSPEFYGAQGGPSLDVERLRQAIENVDGHRRRWPHALDAVDIAAEYARLGVAPEPPE